MEEEEYVLLDLDDVCGQGDIPPNAPFVLSGLDTLNPALTIGATLKLVSVEKEVMHPAETGSLDVSLFQDKCFAGSSQASSKEVQLVAGLHKILKFRIANAY